MIDLKNANRVDPLKRMVEKETGANEFSPMDPPDAFSPPTIDAVPYEEMHLCLQKLVDEHRALSKELAEFEKALIDFRASGWTLNKEIQAKFSGFFSFMDEVLTKHHLKEEKILFPLLEKRLIENQEHSQGRFPKTAIDMLEDDHVKIMQHMTLMFNFLALGAQLPHAESASLTFDVACEQGFRLVELLRLHIFREDNVVYSKAQKYITTDEFAEMLTRFERYARY